MASETVNMSFTGQQIIDAVQSEADRPVLRTFRLKDKLLSVLGQRSVEPHLNLAVTADGMTEIDPDATYERFTVSSCSWQTGRGQTVQPSLNRQMSGVTALASKLKLKILQLQEVAMLSGEVEFAFEGVHYRCSPDALIFNQVILPDGRILEIEKYDDENPLLAIELVWVGNSRAALAHPVVSEETTVV